METPNIETVFLSNPVSRVEKTSDTLYIYVPTGTRYTKAIMDFISYSGKSESIDATDMVMEGKKIICLSQFMSGT